MEWFKLVVNVIFQLAHKMLCWNIIFYKAHLDFINLFRWHIFIFEKLVFLKLFESVPAFWAIFFDTILFKTFMKVWWITNLKKWILIWKVTNAIISLKSQFFWAHTFIILFFAGLRFQNLTLYLAILCVKW